MEKSMVLYASRMTDSRTSNKYILLGIFFLLSLSIHEFTHVFETDDAHHASCELVRNAGLTHLHIFGFSPREGTAAARMPQLEKSVIKSRVAELRSVAQSQLEAHLATRVGGTDMLLVENGQTGHLSGFEKAVLADGAQAAAGDVIAVSIDGHDGERLAVSPLACQPQIEAGTAIKTSQNRQGQK